MTDQRKSMSPLIFETILFLKVNRQFWDVSMVAKAMKMHHTRYEEQLNEEEIFQGYSLEG